MSLRRFATYGILWMLVGCAHVANLVARTGARRAEPVFVAMEHLARLGVRVSGARSALT